MAYGVRLLFRDKNAHNIETKDVNEARMYLEQIYIALKDNYGVFRMLNNKDELVYVCNMHNLVHAMIVTIEEKE
jgi:hypothetical protein